MKVKPQLLQDYLEQKKLSEEEFAKKLGIGIEDVRRMLCGDKVGFNTARKFIRFFTPEKAQHLIDWEAIGVRNPLSEDVTNE